MSRPEIRAVLGLSVLVILLFSDAVFRGGVLYARDVYLVWYAYVEAVRRSLASGSYPFWNPFVAFGQPLWANPAVQVLYPSTWIALLVGPRIGYLLFVVVHLVFSGLGLFLFAQRLGISRVGSFVSAVLWVASGPFLSMATLWHHFAGVAFFPWILLATDTALRRSSPRSTPLGVAVAFQILAGSADACEMSGLLSLAYALHLAEWKPARLLRWAFGWTFGIALGAAQWLPTLAQATQSARWGLPDWIRTYWSLHPWTLSELALPFSISTLPIDARVRGLLFESREPLLLLYVGALSFGIALSSLARPRGAPLFFALAAVVATGVALGKFGPLYPLLTRLIPPLRILRYPVKAMAVTAFSISVLAGLGFETSSDPGLSRLRRCLGLVVPLALLVAASFLAIVFLSHHD